jgi:hypothetical protein
MPPDLSSVEAAQVGAGAAEVDGGSSHFFRSLATGSGGRRPELERLHRFCAFGASVLSRRRKRKKGNDALTALILGRCGLGHHYHSMGKYATHEFIYNLKTSLS